MVGDISDIENSRQALLYLQSHFPDQNIRWEDKSGFHMVYCGSGPGRGSARMYAGPLRDPGGYLKKLRKNLGLPREMEEAELVPQVEELPYMETDIHGLGIYGWVLRVTDDDSLCWDGTEVRWDDEKLKLQGPCENGYLAAPSEAGEPITIGQLPDIYIPFMWRGLRGLPKTHLLGYPRHEKIAQAWGLMAYVPVRSGAVIEVSDLDPFLSGDKCNVYTLNKMVRTSLDPYHDVTLEMIGPLLEVFS